MHANRIYRKNKKMFDLIRTFFLNLKKSCEIRNNGEQYRLVKNMVTG